jgi:hypothetical protein
VLLLPILLSSPLAAQAPPGDTVVAVLDVDFGPARLGENPLTARLRNLTDTTVLLVMDLRAEPGMWLRRNEQRQFPVELGPGEERTVQGGFLFDRLSPEAVLRVSVGPSRTLANGWQIVDHADYSKRFPVGSTSPDAYDPGRDFTIRRQDPLEIYAWRGSLAEQRLDTIAAERLHAVAAVSEMLAVDPPDRIRLVFYPDEATKFAHTEHQGVGLAMGTTLVEVYNADVRLDPYHELAHVVAQAAGDPPAALNEGFAVYAAEELGGDALRFLGAPGVSSDTLVCRARGTPRFVPLEELLALGEIGSREERSLMEYGEAASFVRYLVDRGGMETFRRAYGTLSSGASWSENVAALQGLYGATLQELKRAWLSRC